MRSTLTSLCHGGALSLLMLAHAADVGAQEEGRPSLLNLSLEELVDLEVTSVSMKEERWFTAPAAVHVITGKDLRRSGVTSLAEALRLVPGMQVARYNSSQWAISARGFNEAWANKLLVLIDGRSVYNPLFAGVEWDIQDLVFEDVARIEVIRGPGATLWGANAVNGVINVVTKSSTETQGALLSAGSGTEDRVLGTARYGLTLRPGLSARVFGKYTRRERLPDPLTGPMTDAWDVARLGGRVDWHPGHHHQLTVDGAVYDGDVPELYSFALSTPPFQTLSDTVAMMAGGWLAGRWEHRISNRSALTLKAHFDRTARTRAIMHDVQETWDFEARHRFTAGPNEVVWGAGYRHYVDRFTSSFSLSFEPGRRQDDLLSFFVQNEMTLIQNRLTLTAGTKLEHNDYSGFEIQPNIRMLWTPHPRHTVWASTSRAVRTPSRSDQDVRLTAAIFPDSTGLLTYVEILGTPDFRPEELLAFEAGYRVRPARNLWFDISAFYNVYDHVRTGVNGQPYFETTPAPGHVVAPLAIVNGAEGTTRGAELFAHVQPTPRWMLMGSYSTIAMNIRDKSVQMPSGAEVVAGDTPTHQGYLHSELDLPVGLEFDATLFAVDDLPNQQVPAYTRFDARAGWRASWGLTFSLGIQNAFRERHAEFGTSLGPNAAEVERSLVGRVTWRF